MTEANVKAPSASESRPWAVRALTLLLFLQAAGLFAIGLCNFLSLSYPGTGATSEATLTMVTRTLTNSLVFGALAILALVAAFSFMGLWRTGWSISMMVQGLGLLVALVIYFGDPQFYAYIMMVYGILMVIYLHHPDVQAAFQVKPAPEGGEVEV